MTKVTLDDIEYDSKDFNETQNKIIGELIQNNNIRSNLKYQLASLEVVSELLMKKIKKSLTEEVSNGN